MNGGPARYLTVTVPVANLRRKPVDASPLNTHDDLQESQLLFNEVLIVREETEDWFRVEATEQLKFVGTDEWRGYPGWVRKREVAEVEKPATYNGMVRAPFTTVISGPRASSVRMLPLSLGTRLLITGESRTFFEIELPRQKTGWTPKKDVVMTSSGRHGAARTGDSLVGLARLFLGASYLWGGRSMPLPWSRGPVMGVDCSGLVDLVFRADFLDVPRNAYDQWVASRPVAPTGLTAGDLIFVSREGQTEAIDHVMISSGGEQFIEASETGDTVRMRTFYERFGLDMRQLEQRNFTVKGKRVYFGRMGEE